jgi:hypothetical protein
MHRGPVPQIGLLTVVFVVAIVFGLLVWHATRASQAHQAIQSRRAQIRGLWQDVRTFTLRGIAVLIVFIIVMVAVLRHLPPLRSLVGALRHCA